MTEIIKEIYRGFDENPQRAWLEILVVLMLTVLLLGFLYFYAEPIHLRFQSNRDSKRW